MHGFISEFLVFYSDCGSIEIDHRFDPAPASNYLQSIQGKKVLIILSNFTKLDIHFDIRNTFSSKRVRFDSYNVKFKEDNPYTKLIPKDELGLSSGGSCKWLRPQGKIIWWILST